jgi:hypothetical protein
MFGKMKARCNFIVLLLGFLAACTRPSQVPELEVAEQSRSIEGPSVEEILSRFSNDHFLPLQFEQILKSRLHV